MTALNWLVRLIIFAFLLVFALQNTAPVTLTLGMDLQWQAPLVIILLAFFAAGAVLGMLSLLGTIYSKRREISRLNGQLKKLQAEREHAANIANAPNALPPEFPPLPPLP